LRKGIAVIFTHIFLILLAATLFIPSYNFSLSSDNFDVNATLVPQINDRDIQKYAWYLSGSATVIEDFEDLTHSFTETVPSTPFQVFHATSIYSYKGTLSGSVTDTYYDDGVALEATDEGTSATAEIVLRIDVSSISTGTSYDIYWDTSALSLFDRQTSITVKLLDSSGATVATISTGVYSGSYTRSKGSEYYVELDVRADDSYNPTFGEPGYAAVSVDWFEAKIPSTSAGTISTEIIYVASKAGTTSENAGFSPLFELGSQLYGYHATDVVTETGTWTFTHTWDFTDVDAGTAVVDFCIFVNYATVNGSLANYIKLIIEYVYTSGTVQYIVYFAPGETGTLEQGSNYIMYRTAVKTLWVGLKTFNNKQPSEITTVSGSLQKLRVKVEFSVVATGTDEPRCDFVIDWIGAWTPQDEISSIKYNLFYEISHKGFDNITIVTMPTLDYDSSEYRQVLLFYDTRYPTLWSWGWTSVDSVFTGLEDYLPQLGFAVQRVDADELANYLSGGVKAIVLILSGCMPDTIYDPANNNYLIQNWIRNSGGVLIWAGDRIGFYVGHADGTYTKVGTTGDEKVLGADIIGGAYNGYTYSSLHNLTSLAVSLNIEWNDDGSYSWFRPLCVDYYEQNEGKNYLLYVWAKRVVLDSEYKTSEVVKVAIGWFQFGNGWALIFPVGVTYSGAVSSTQQAIHNIVMMIATAPFRQNKDSCNLQIWNDSYITMDTFYNDVFSETNSPDEEDPTYGFGEDFTDISDWSVETYVIASTDGDIVNITLDASTATTTQWRGIIITFSTIDTATYPFLEIRYKYYYESDPAGQYFYVAVRNASGLNWVTVFSDTDVGDWEIRRYNLRALLNDFDINGIFIRLRSSAGNINKVLVDWIRVYTISSAMSIWGVTNKYIYVYSDNDVMHIVKTFDSTNNEYYFVRFDVSDVSTSGLYLEARLKVSSPNVFGYFYASIDGVRKQVTPAITDTEWTIIKIDLSQYGTILDWIEVGINDVSDSLASGTYTLYVDYIKIGSKGDWRPIQEFSASKFYDNPYWHFYDSLVSPRFNLPENIPTGVYQYTLGVLILIWGYNYIDGDYMYIVEQQDVTSIRAIHTYSWNIFFSKPHIELTYSFTWPPNLAIIPLGSWLLWIYAICLDFFAIDVKKRQLLILATLLIIAGLYLII
jgi:hypothetical protein